MAFATTDALPLEQSKQQQLLFQFINSLAAYVLAFWLVYMLSNLGACLLAGSYNWKSRLLYYGFNTQPVDGIIYRRRSIVSIYALAPLICLGLGLLARFAHFRYARNRNNFVKPVLFWMIMHGINLSMGNTIVALILSIMEQKRMYRGIGHSFEWAHTDGISLYFILAFATITEVASGFLLTRLSFQNAQHRIIFSDNTDRSKVAFTVSNVVLPWIVGGFITFFFRLPFITELDITLVFLMGALVIPILSFSTYKHRISLAKTDTGSQFHLFYPLLILAVLITIVIRVFFSDEGVTITSGL